jgi:hypothetical protein
VTRDLIVSGPADDDIDEYLDYLNERNPAAARRFLQAFRQEWRGCLMRAIRCDLPYFRKLCGHTRFQPKAPRVGLHSFSMIAFMSLAW